MRNPKSSQPDFNSAELKPSADAHNYELQASILEFVDTLKARGISLVLRRNRVNAGAQQKLLSADERAFINQHRAVLKKLLQDPQRGQRGSTASLVAPVVPPEPEPVMWTYDYTRRITAADVEAAGVLPGLSKQKAYERAREWLHEQQLAREEETHILMRHHAAKGRALQGEPTRGVWEDLGYE